jgi:CubicO group peptidase (beta-lactamase class C family)
LRSQYSNTKSVISALTGLAIDRGLIERTASEIFKYLPNSIRAGMSEDAKRITIHHLLTTTSGFEDNGGTGSVNAELLGAYFRRGLNHAPGEAFADNGNNPNLPSVIITEKSGMRASEFARKHLFHPIGIKQAKWDEDVKYTMRA